MSEGFYEKISSFVLNSTFCVECADIYKMLYQSFHGAGHAVHDEKDAVEWFWDEWEYVKANEGCVSPMVENLEIPGITPPLARVHLRKYYEYGGDPQALLDEFLRTAREFPQYYPSNEVNLHKQFIRAWGVVGVIVERREPGMSIDGDYRSFTAEMESNGWPVISHSKLYREKFSPHYRLVMDLKKVIPQGRIDL